MKPPTHPNDNPDPLAGMLQRLRAYSISSEAIESDDPYLRVLAEFLLLAEFQPRSWWVASRDPAPGPGVNRLFDGVNHHFRVGDVWQREPTSHFPEKAGKLARRRWEDFGDRIMADATIRAGETKIKNPSPGGPLADWQTGTPEQVRAMLLQSLELLEQAIAHGTAAGTAGTRWTPSDRGPILLITLGPDVEPPYTLSEHHDQD